VAVVLLRLKLAIQRRAWGHGGTGQRLAFVFGWLLALVLGLGAGDLVAFLDSSRDGLGDLALVLLLTVVFVSWVLIPVVMPGISDQTVDPARLEQYPISAGQQVAGLLLGALIAPTAMFTFLLAAGGTFAAGESVSARVFVLAAAVVFTVLCVAASRSVQALLAGVLQSRRGRDVAIAATGVLALGGYLISRSANNLTETLLELESAPTEAVLSWLPPGAIGQGMIAVRDGQWGPALAHLLVALAGIGVAVAAWAWAIRRRVRGASGRSAGRGRQRTSAEVSLAPVPLSAWRPSPTLASASQQARYFFFRSPRAVQSAALPAVMGIILAHTFVNDGGLVVAAVFFVLLALLSTAFNLFAFDDTGFSYLIATATPWRPVLIGKALVGLLIVGPVLAALIVVEAALNDVWSSAVAAFAAGTSVALVVMGVGAVISVVAPMNQVHPAGANRGRVLAGVMAGLAAVVLILGLAGFAWVLLSDRVDSTWMALATLPVAGLLAWALLRYAGGRLERDPWRVHDMLHA
jgi:ABC-2 type transport system permease protein